MNKIVLVVFLIGFWLFLPIPMIYMNIGNYDYLRENDLSDLDKYENERPSFLNFLNEIGYMVGIYLKLLFFTIPNAPALINYFLLFLKSLTGVFLFVMLRGN